MNTTEFDVNSRCGPRERTFSRVFKLKQETQVVEEKPAKPEPGARAREWARLLAEGVYGSRAELARAMGVSRAAVTQALRQSHLPIRANDNT